MEASTKARLEYLRSELRAERISMGELVELQGLAAEGKIDSGDVELLEAAGVPEFPESPALPKLENKTQVVLLTDTYAPQLSAGAVGTITKRFDDISYEITFSNNRVYILREELIRLATAEEIAANDADPDLDERFTTKPGLPKFYDCGICGHWHPADWDGDCRDDANRFTTSAIEDKYGQEGEGWEEVPMPGGDEE